MRWKIIGYAYAKNLNEIRLYAVYYVFSIYKCTTQSHHYIFKLQQGISQK